MNTSKKEYSSTQTNAVSCYNRIGSISGSGGSITAPTFVTAVPQFAYAMRPYKMPDLSGPGTGCYGYKSSNAICRVKSEPVLRVAPGFNDVSGFKC